MITIPTALFEKHEEFTNLIIEDLGSVCTLVFPDKWTECDNCYIDIHTQRSSNIYKSGGPASFPINTMCPRCNGNGRLSNSTTDTIKARIYTTPKAWSETGMYVANPDGAAVLMGYKNDMVLLREATKIIVNNFPYSKEGDIQLYGFRKLYFIQVLRICP